MSARKTDSLPSPPLAERLGHPGAPGGLEGVVRAEVVRERGRRRGLAGGAGVPVVHTVELLDWATGGPKPAKIAAAEAA